MNISEEPLFHSASGAESQVVPSKATIVEASPPSPSSSQARDDGDNQETFSAHDDCSEVVDQRTGEISRTCDCHQLVRIRRAGLRYITRGFRVLPLHGMVLHEDLRWCCTCAGSDGVCLVERPGKHPRPVQPPQISMSGYAGAISGRIPILVLLLAYGRVI